jgi:hypothetical protein
MKKLKDLIPKYKLKKGGVFDGSDAGAFFGDAGKAIADTTLSAAGLSNVIKDDAYKSESADSFIKGAKIAGTVSKAALPFALSAVGVPAPITTAAQGLIGNFNPEDETSGIQTMGKGGQSLKALINVEKNELEVNPKTGAIVKDFKDKPYHPENDDMINLKGNTRAKLGNVIIPKNMRKEYLSSNQEGQMEIIHELMEQTNESMKMQEGGDVVLPNGQKYPSTPLSNFLPPSNKPLYDIPKGEIVDGVDTGMVDRTEAIIRPTQTRLWQTREMIDKMEAFDSTKGAMVKNKKGVKEERRQMPQKLIDNIGDYVVPQMKNTYQRVLTAELQKKAGVGNQITNQFLTPEEAQKALIADNPNLNYKDYIDFFNTYQKYREKTTPGGIPLKSVKGSKNPEEEYYGVRHARLFTPQNIVPVTNNTPNTRKEGGMVSLKDCGMSKRYDGKNGSVVDDNIYQTPLEAQNASDWDAAMQEFNQPYEAQQGDYGYTGEGTQGAEGDSSFNMGSLAALGANSGTIGLGLNQSIKAGKALKELAKKEVPNYSIDPLFKQGYEGAINNARQLAGTSKAAAGYGFNSAQRAQFNSNLAQQNNTAFRLAESRSGGNLSKAINAAINSQNISGQNQFAVNDANLQNQKQMYADKTGTSLGELQMRYGKDTQFQKDKATREDIARRMEMERAYGKAKSQGDTNLANAGNSLGSLLSLVSKMA